MKISQVLEVLAVILLAVAVAKIVIYQITGIF
jgi:hypothetical protein